MRAFFACDLSDSPPKVISFFSFCFDSPVAVRCFGFFAFTALRGSRRTLDVEGAVCVASSGVAYRSGG